MCSLLWENRLESCWYCCSWPLPRARRSRRWRQDAFAKAHPIIPEVWKTGDERGRYLHPAENGQPESLGIDYARAKLHSPEPAAHMAPALEPPKLDRPKLPQPPVTPRPSPAKLPVTQQRAMVPVTQK